MREKLLLCLAALLVKGLEGKAFQGEPGFGRNLVVRALPGVPDLQSNVYEVFVPSGPGYFSDYNGLYNNARAQKGLDLNSGARPAPGLQAIAILVAANGTEEGGVSGELTFYQEVPYGPVVIEGTVTGLAAGLHGAHIHQKGAIRKNSCDDLGPHFSAFYGRHGGPRDQVRHVGDLGNIKAVEGQPLSVRIVDPVISLSGPRSVVGRAIAITQDEDDYGRGATDDSVFSGSSGPPVACAVIAYN